MPVNNARLIDQRVQLRTFRIFYYLQRIVKNYDFYTTSGMRVEI